MRELTKQEAAIITAINGYVDENECPPTTSDIANVLGYDEFILSIDLVDMKDKGLVNWRSKDQSPALIWSTYER